MKPSDFEDLLQRSACKIAQIRSDTINCLFAIEINKAKKSLIS